MIARYPLPPGVVLARAKDALGNAVATRTELDFKLKALRGEVGMKPGSTFELADNASPLVGVIEGIAQTKALDAAIDKSRAVEAALPATMPADGAVPTPEAIVTALLGAGIQPAERRKIADELRVKAFDGRNLSVHLRLEDPDGEVQFDVNIDKESAAKVASLLDVRDAPHADLLGSTALPRAVSVADTTAGNVAAGAALLRGIASREGLSSAQTLSAIDRVIAERTAREADIRVNSPTAGVAFAVTKASLSRWHAGASFTRGKATPWDGPMEENPAPGSASDILLKGFLAWVVKPFAIERASHSVTHKLCQQIPLTAWAYDATQGKMVAKVDYEGAMQVVLVEHDWARLLGDSRRDGVGVEEWRTPYDLQAFEFKVSGAVVVAMVAAKVRDDDSVASTMSVSVRPPGLQNWVSDRCSVELAFDGWRPLVGAALANAGDPMINAQFSRLYDFLFAQVKACSIMLDAEVAVTETTRAPYKTNQPPKDKDAKPLPLLSHHVVRLNRKPRYTAEPGGAGVDRRGPRMHLRRGHWRHYPNYKKWIKWMVIAAANADLGFVDKEYRQ